MGSSGTKGFIHIKWSQILQSLSDHGTVQRRPPSLSHILCVAVALASAAPEVSVPGRLSSQCSTALRTNLPVCLSWPWLTQAQPTWLTPDTLDKWTPDSSRRRRMADTALKFGPEWLRALTEPQGGTDGGGKNWLILPSLHLMLLTSPSHMSPYIAILVKRHLLNPCLKRGQKKCSLTSIGVTLVGGMFYLWTHCYRARITSSAPVVCKRFWFVQRLNATWLFGQLGNFWNLHRVHAPTGGILSGCIQANCLMAQITILLHKIWHSQKNSTYTGSSNVSFEESDMIANCCKMPEKCAHITKKGGGEGQDKIFT